MTTPKRAILEAAADLQRRTGQRGLKSTISAALRTRPRTRDAGGATRCSVSAKGSRGPLVAWTLQDGEFDPAAGITITLDETLIPLDYEVYEYAYSGDGRFQRRDPVDYTALMNG